MRSLALTALWLLFGVVVRAQQPAVDPAYLRQYYQQLQQQQQQQHGSLGGDSTPIYEQNAEQAQYSAVGPSQGQQYRLKDTVQDQVRSQQHNSYVAPAVRAQYQTQQHPQPQHQQQHHAQPQQQIVYRQPAAAAIAQPRPAAAQPLRSKLQLQQQQQQEEEEYDDQNSSYQFGFDVKDDEFTNYQNRKEVRDGGVIKGSYSVVDSDGFIRTVKYTADPKEGFKAEVIREPTDIVVKIPTPAPQQQLLRAGGGFKQQQQQQHQPQQHHHQQQPQQQQYHQYQ